VTGHAHFHSSNSPRSQCISARIIITFSVILLAASLQSFAATASHVVIVLEENHSYSQVIGNSSMPYLNSLARKYGLATSYYANAHPSLPNYFELTVGNVVTYNDAYTGTYTGNNIVRQLLLAGKTWKAYAEELPYAGYLGGDHLSYVKHHNPFAYISDVKDSSQKMNIVPFSQFHTDLMNRNLPNYSFVVPDNLDNGHSASLGTADAWLKNNISPLFSNPEFLSSGVLIIVFDEALQSDITHGGGHVAMVVAGPNAVLNSRFTPVVQHQSLLRLTCTLLALSHCPGSAATAPAITGLTK
jgi:phosphatidylinositol-3-phosphatase